MYLLHNVWYLYGYIEIIKAHKKPVISYHQTQIWYDSKVVISCHKHRSKHLNFNYIYRISYKNAKKASPEKRICPYKNDITSFFWTRVVCFIAEIATITVL